MHADIRCSHIVHGENGRFGTPDRQQGLDNIIAWTGTGEAIEELAGTWDFQHAVLIKRARKARRRTRAISGFSDVCLAGAKLAGLLEDKTVLIELFPEDEPDDSWKAMLGLGAELLVDEEEFSAGLSWRTAFGFPMKNPNASELPRSEALLSLDMFDFAYRRNGSVVFVYDMPLSCEQAEQAARFIRFTEADETARRLCLLIYQGLRPTRYERGRQVSIGIGAFSFGLAQEPPQQDAELFQLQFDKLRSEGELVVKHASERVKSQHGSIAEAEKYANTIRDIEKLWNHGVALGGQTPQKAKAVLDAAENMMKSYGDETDESRAYVSALADVLGIDHMLDAYRNGVPIEYIVAGSWKNDEMP